MNQKSTLDAAVEVYRGMSAGEVKEIDPVSNITRFKQRLNRGGLVEYRDFVLAGRHGKTVITKVSDRNPPLNQTS